MAAFAKLLFAPAAALLLLLPVSELDTAQSRIPPRYYGVNLASGEFGGDKLPGVHGTDYIYPTRATAEPFRAMGMNSVRVPVLWERLQPDLSKPLSTAELERLDSSLSDLKDFRQVIIDVHNYARYRGEPLRPGDHASAALASLWTQLADRYKNQPNVAFGIMNEPHGISAREWRSIAEATVKAIRRTGAKNLILVPGTNWTGGHSWRAGGAESNAEALANFTDPAGNFVFEIHQYLDSDSSGTHRGCSGVQAGRERLEGVTRWLREQRAKAILGEFGVDQSETCLAALDNLLDFLGENGDVWIGWNYWAGGDWWGDYPLSVQPVDGREKPQAAVLRRHVESYVRR